MKVEKWIELAKKAQQLNFCEETEEEYQKNLEKLDNILQSLGIEGSLGKRKPETIYEIGILSLLQSIQNIHVPKQYKRATFCEKIYQLANIGVEKINFYPMDYYGRFSSGAFRRYSNENIVYQKCYTDGIFQIDKVCKVTAHEFILYNIHNMNYVLFTTLNKSLTNDENCFIEQKSSCVFLNTFNGSYPSKEEIMKFSFPELVSQEQSLIWGESPKVRERFETYNSGEAGYQKRLTRAQDGEYYYRES